MISTNPQHYLQQAYNIAGQRGLSQSDKNIAKIAEQLAKAGTVALVEDLNKTVPYGKSWKYKPLYYGDLLEKLGVQDKVTFISPSGNINNTIQAHHQFPPHPSGLPDIYITRQYHFTDNPGSIRDNRTQVSRLTPDGEVLGDQTRYWIFA